MKSLTSWTGSIFEINHFCYAHPKQGVIKTIANQSCVFTGPKPHKSFSVSNGPSEVRKEFDSEIKSNVFAMSGQRIQLPPNPQTVPADFHHNNAVNQMATKKMSVNASLNIVHQFLVFQLYVPQGEPFSLELHVRDKNNVSISNLEQLGQK